MPVYNGESYIDDAIDSVLAQAFSDFELIIVNDGSTDNSLRLIQDYDDHRIKCLSRDENRGLAVTRNEGVAAASGQYVAMLDCDDIANPARLEIQTAYLDENQDIGVVGSWVEIIDEAGAVTGDVWRFEASPQRLPAALLFHNCFAQSSIMARRELLGEAPYRSDFPPAEDYDLWVRLASHTRLANISKPLVRYRCHQGGTSRKKTALAESNTSKIIIAQLEKLGLTPTSRDMQVHRYLGKSLSCDDSVTFDLAEKWLERLLSANRLSRVYDETVFREVIHDRWFSFCEISSSYGLQSFRNYRQSPLSQDSTLSLRKLCGFALRCASKK